MPQTFTILGNSDFPPLLREMQDPPNQLYIRGLLPKDALFLSIVGTRKASREGMNIAEGFAEYFAAMKVVVVSGLAMGIDAAAHRGSLNRGGTTVAVLGTSLDKIYPASNAKLAERIVQEKGALISEYSPGEPFYRGNFLRRNRIISGLSLAVLVIEAPQHSGSLATARFAAEQGREVFVVPGALRDANYIGSHDLIRDGAILVTSPEQLAEDMGWQEIRDNHQVVDGQGNLNAEEELIVNLLHGAGIPLKVDNIIKLAKLEPRIVSVNLAALIIKGLVIEDATGYKPK